MNYCQLLSIFANVDGFVDFTSYNLSKFKKGEDNSKSIFHIIFFLFGVP